MWSISIAECCPFLCPAGATAAVPGVPQVTSSTCAAMASRQTSMRTSESVNGNGWEMKGGESVAQNGSRWAMPSQAKSLTLLRTTWVAIGDGATARQYTAAISFLGRQKLWQHACEIFCAMPKAQVNTISYNAVITACKKGSKWQLAINFFEQGLLQGMSDVISYSAAMMSCVDALQWQAALKLFHLMPAANVIAYSSAITCCEKSAQWERAFAIFEDMKKKTVTPNVVTFNAVISCSKDSQRASQLFLEMSSLKIQPDIVSYTSWINACQHWQHALLVFSSMARLQPNLISFNSLLKSCEKASQWRMALRLLKDMRLRQLRCDIVSYNSTISAFEKASEWQKAIELFQRLTSPDLFTYNALMSSCEKAAQWQKAQQLFFSLSKPDLISYSALTSAFEKAVRWQRALELIQLFRREKVGVSGARRNQMRRSHMNCSALPFAMARRPGHWTLDS